ncbi:phosphatidate cytidylyltransferase [Neolewinella agarilytica]|uniref:Phosphatidate cytidylyltransferase n=1 Tax=Neolewinella agarilytica TaxID=478744 RepID=A0A1H9FL12_9BACT|nr:phosphatidate cytidylyltransferase [Neolewinella agarilytica]SEQ38559.1 phosphatidate cytidylyltransferase [Neolewinella agarilytica]
MQGLWRRLTTAIIFVIIMVAGHYTGVYTFSLLFFIIAAGCLWEFFGLTLDLHTRRDKIRKTIAVALGLMPFVLVTTLSLLKINDPENFITLSSLLFSPFVFTIFIYELYSHSKEPFANIAFMILGLFYIGVPFALVDFIAYDGDSFNSRIVLGLLVLTWVNDTGAYLTGSMIGKTPLFPRISPNKTWEGSSGGFITTLVFGYLLSLVFTEIPLAQWMGLAVIVAIFGSLGDLVESMLKRSVNVKDSGNLLPGHGGLLDRFDAFIFVVPFATAYLLYLR